jgi:TPR repeat protein
MPNKLISCVSLPPATISILPIYDFAQANKKLADEATEKYYPCCGKSICGGCIHSFRKSGNDDKCPFCNSNRSSRTREEMVGEFMKRAAVNDPGAICLLAGYYYHGRVGLQQDHAKAMELYAKAADLGCSQAHCRLGDIYREGGNMKKAKLHLEAAAIAGHEGARNNLGIIEAESGNMDRAVKHLRIAASAGHYKAMHTLRTFFDQGIIGRESIKSTLKAYNNSCVEMRSEARDAFIQILTETDKTASNNT